jgi:hypothetical protein
MKTRRREMRRRFIEPSDQNFALTPKKNVIPA